MRFEAVSTRPFIGAKDFALAKAFYAAIGFTVTEIQPDFCVCANQSVIFYLQDYFVKDWIDNTMLFIEVTDVQQCYQDLKALDLPSKFKGVRLTPIREEPWGKECFLHDPSGILWHFGSFTTK
jgi:hypothetical protein